MNKKNFLTGTGQSIFKHLSRGINLDIKCTIIFYKCSKLEKFN